MLVTYVRFVSALRAQHIDAGDVARTLAGLRRRIRFAGIGGAAVRLLARGGDLTAEFGQILACLHVVHVLVEHQRRQLMLLLLQLQIMLLLHMLLHMMLLLLLLLLYLVLLLLHHQLLLLLLIVLHVLLMQVLLHRRQSPETAAHSVCVHHVHLVHLLADVDRWRGGRRAAGRLRLVEQLLGDDVVIVEVFIGGAGGVLARSVESS